MSDNATDQKETTKVRMKAIVQDGYGAPEQVLELEEVDRPSVGRSREAEIMESARELQATTMKAIVAPRYGSAEVLEYRDVPKPVVGDDDVLVRVHASSVNPADWHGMTGTPFLVRIAGGGFRKPKQPILGSDVAGSVEAVGANVTEFRPGDEVFGGRAGAYAEYVTATSKSAIVPKPANVTVEEVAGVAIAGLTALQGLRDKGKVRAGQKVLINGASGGVGTYAVQIAKSYGAEVTAVCSTRNVEMVRSIGADHVIDYTQEDFTHSGQYDLFYDAIGNRSLTACRRAIKPGGIYVGVSGPKQMYRLFPRMLRMAVLSLFGSRKMGPMLAKHTKEDMAALADLLESGKVRTVIDRRYPLSETADAMRYQEQGHAQGKTVITIG
jgi:NADPH:quinone reductase-like Zn-dependent oxidoreductase